MIAIDAVQRTIVLVKKFGIYLCVPVFLMIAYSYTSSTYPKYRVSTKIAVRGAPVESAVADISSKYLVRKALDQLPLQASYYDSNSPREEVFGNALPVKMIFERASYSEDEVWLNLEVTGKNSFALTHGDTVAYYEFNKPVHEWYGNFRVMHKPGAQYSHATYIVRLGDPAKIQDAYYNNLRVEAADDGSVSVSIVSGNPQKGIAFLNKLLQLYGGSKHSAAHHTYARTGRANTSGSFTILDKPEDNIESVGLNSFWSYLLALIAALLIPVGLSVINGRQYVVLPFKLSGMYKLSRRSPHPVVVKQLGLKVARYRRLLFKEA